MCMNYTEALTKGLRDLDDIQNMALKKEVFKLNVCDCKKDILTNYYNALGAVLVDVVNFLFNKDVRSEEELDFIFLKNKFYKLAYEDLYKRPNISKKLLYLFEVYHKPIENLMFRQIEKNLKEYFEQGKLQKYHPIIINSIVDYAEFIVFALASFKIDCNNISSNLFSEMKNPPIKNICANHTCEICPNFEQCKHHKELKEEEFHIYMFKEFNEDDGWLIPLIELLLKYHKNPKNIKIVVDYKLFPSFSYTEYNIKRCEYILKHFTKIQFINYEHIDFKKCTFSLKERGII